MVCSTDGVMVLLLSCQVLELLCQILQTDSLSTVQQWLLLAGQRGKMLLHSTYSGATVLL